MTLRRTRQARVVGMRAALVGCAAVLATPAALHASERTACPSETPIVFSVAASSATCRPSERRFCSPADALAAVAAHQAAVATPQDARHIEVHLDAGVHRLTETLRMTSAHGGVHGCRVTWRTAPAARGRAQITSAIDLPDAAWRPWRDGVWRTPMPQALYDASLAVTREVDPAARTPTIAGARNLLSPDGPTMRAGVYLETDRRRDGRIVERKSSTDPIYAPDDANPVNRITTASQAGKQVPPSTIDARGFIVRPGVLPDGVGDLAAMVREAATTPQQIELVTRYLFMRQYLPAVTEFDGDTIRLRITDTQAKLLHTGIVGTHAGYYLPSPDRIENARVFLDEPGEFFIEFDRTPGVQAAPNADRGDFIYFKPLKPGRPKGAALPLLDTLVSVDGTEQAQVRDLYFHSIDVTGTTVKVPVGVTGPRERGYFGIQATMALRAPDSDAPLSVTWATFNDEFIHKFGFREQFLPSAMELRYVLGGGLTQMRFSGLGNSALALDRGIRGHGDGAPYLVTQNRFEKLAANGVRIGNIDAEGADGDRMRANDYHPYGDVPESAWPADRARVNEHILLSENVFQNIGIDFEDAVGLFYANTRRLTVDKNTFFDLPYTAINAGYGFGFFDGPQPADPNRRYGYVNQTVMGKNRITRNRILNHSTLTDDGGGIYSNSAQGDTWVEGNVFRPQNYEVRWGGTYMDEGTSRLHWRDNVFSNARNVVMFNCWSPEPQTYNTIERLYWSRPPVPDSNARASQLPGVDHAMVHASCDADRLASPNGIGDNFPRRVVDFGDRPLPPLQEAAPSLNPQISRESFIRLPDERALYADPRVRAIYDASGATPGLAPPSLYGGALPSIDELIARSSP